VEIEVFIALTKAGVPEDKAREVAYAIRDHIDERIAWNIARRDGRSISAGFAKTERAEGGLSAPATVSRPAH
jgi:hypothetical protein